MPVRHLFGAKVPEASTDADPGDKQFANTGSKVLPGYNPESAKTRSVDEDRSLEGEILTDGVSEQEEQVSMEKSDEEALKEKSDELEGLQMAEPEVEPEEAPPEEEAIAPETAEESEAAVIRTEIYRQTQRRMTREEIAQRHKQLSAKLDRAIAAEKYRAAEMRAVENKKKNTLDYALKVYGDDADVAFIMNSAERAKSGLNRSSQTAMADLQASMKDAAKDADEVMFLTESGHVRMMDRDVAEAMQQYMAEQKQPSLMEQAAAGFELEQTTRTETQYFQLNQGEVEKIQQLYSDIEEHDKEDDAFTQKTPSTMTDQEYDQAMQDQRERRLKEYGDPSRDVYYMRDHEITYGQIGPDGKFREYPTAVSSPDVWAEVEPDAADGRQRQQDGPSY